MNNDFFQTRKVTFSDLLILNKLKCVNLFKNSKTRIKEIIKHQHGYLLL